MNESNKISGKSTPADAGHEVKRLAAIIGENCATLDKGWEELARLTQTLASLDSIKSKAMPPANPLSPDNLTTNLSGNSSIVVVEE